MKKLLFLGLVALFACNNQGNSKKSEKTDTPVVLTVDELQTQGKDLVGKEVVVKGTVTHVCKESGARCFIMGTNEDATVRIEAGKIGSFSQGQMGTDIKVRGILREVKLDEQDLEEMKTAAAAGEPANKEHALGHDGQAMHAVDGGQHDSLSQTEKIAQLNEKLEKSGEGYVPVYFLEGVELVAEEK